MRLRHILSLAGVAALSGMLIAAKPSGSSQNEERGVGPKTADDFMTLVGTFVDLGQFDNAMETIEDYERKMPSSAGNHFMRGYVLHKQKKFAEAWYEYQYEAMKVGVDRPLGGMAAQGCAAIVNNERGTDVDEIKRVMKALSEPKNTKLQLTELLDVEKFRGSRPALTQWIAEAKARNNDANGARALYDRLIANDKLFVPAYAGKAALAKKAGKTKDAQALVARAKAIDPDHWTLR